MVDGNYSNAKDDHQKAIILYQNKISLNEKGFESLLLKSFSHKFLISHFSFLKILNV